VAQRADAGVGFFGRGSASGPLPISRFGGELSLPPTPVPTKILGFAVGGACPPSPVATLLVIENFTSLP